MRTKLRSKVTLFFIVSALLLAIPAVAALAQDTSTSTAAPTIQSDKADYAPGELVTLTGSGWQPGESVNVFVNDEEGQTWSRNVDVTADESGNITDQFNLPDWFVATYKVTATGELSGVATTSFTDGNVSAKMSGLSEPIILHWDKYNNTDCSGFPDFSQGTFMFPDVEQLLTGVDDGQSIRLAPLGVPVGGPLGFVNWTSGSEERTDLAICVVGSTAEQVWTANFGATSVNTTTAASNASATYDASSVQLNATVTPTSGTAAVNTGTVTFTVKNSAGTTIGNPVTSGTVSNGSASASFPLSGVSADTYTIEAVYNAGTGFNASNNSTQSPAPTLTFNKADTTTTVTCTGAPFHYTGSAQTPCSATVTGPGGLNQAVTPVTYTNNTDAGTATASASFAGNGNYNASSDTENFTIQKADTTTTVSCGAGPFTYDGTAKTPCSAEVTGPGGLSQSLTVSYQDNVNAGQATASASYAETANYKGSSDTKTFTIGKKVLLVNAKDQSTVYGDENLPPTYELSGFVNNENKDSAGITGAPECSISGSAGPNVGEYSDAIVCAPGTLSADNYSFAAGSNGKLTITKRPITVTADNQSKKLGDPNPTFTASYSGFVNGEDNSVLGGSLGFTTNVPSPEQVGTWDITPSGLTSSNYSITFVKGTLTITSVTYNFSGFRSPVDNPGTGATPVFNSAKAGQSIPVKFGLGGNQGLNIIAAGYPKVTSVNCVSSAAVDPIEEYAASTAVGGLNYDATADQYNYVWKTQSTYVNKCYKFDLQLTDGTSHVAYFKFLK